MTDEQVITLYHWLILVDEDTLTVAQKRAKLRARWPIADEAELLTGVHLDLEWLAEIGVLP